MDGKQIGGAAVASDTPGIDLLEGRRDLAVLWDIRVDPSVRGRGVGLALFSAAAAWARSRGCRQLKVETQNVNVAACRLYAREGCMLGAAHEQVYPAFPHETQLLWYRNLRTP
jgi:GNAT superfamily N-acetyltransferase